MTSMMEKNLTDEIEAYIKSIGELEETPVEKPMKTRDKIIPLIAEDGKQSAATLAKKIGISAKAVEKMGMIKEEKFRRMAATQMSGRHKHFSSSYFGSIVSCLLYTTLNEIIIFD